MRSLQDESQKDVRVNLDLPGPWGAATYRLVLAIFDIIFHACPFLVVEPAERGIGQASGDCQRQNKHDLAE